MSPKQLRFASDVQGNLTRLHSMLNGQRESEILDDNPRQAEMLSQCMMAVERAQWALHGIEAEYQPVSDPLLELLED
jgi:hypothetical protein